LGLIKPWTLVVVRFTGRFCTCLVRIRCRVRGCGL